MPYTETHNKNVISNTTIQGFIMRYMFVFTLVAALLVGCIGNPRGGGLTANLFTWEDRDNPIATVTTDERTAFSGLFFGAALFTDLLNWVPDIDTSPDRPYLLSICDQGICYYSVLFPDFFSVNAQNQVTGFAAINALTTTFFYQVTDLPAAQVRAALDQYALLVVASELDSFTNGSIGYEDIAQNDYDKFPTNLVAFIDSGITSLAETTVDSGATTSIGALLTGDSDSGGSDDGSTGATGNLLVTSWRVNDTNTRSGTIRSADGSQGALVNIESVQELGDYVRVTHSGIPDYTVEITQSILSWLNARPRASSDFGNGSAIVQAGALVDFGEDIGYNSSAQECSRGEGFGYWPPGPGCPTDQERSIDFPVTPIPTQETCDTSVGSVGYYVNGTSVYNWTDAQTYNDEGVWQTLAPVAEVYDVDICGGHAANGDYHHHFYSECLADLVGDSGTAHSPVYGFAADGYPIYGPWQAQGELARSSWAIRDYANINSATGCGSAGQRTCLLVDQFDPGAGTTPASSDGPTTSGTFESLSRNTFTTVAGFFFEDFYWDENLAAQGGNYLDQYNGHSHDDLGYHYHVTIEFEDDSAVPAFPYSVGPRYAGELQDNAGASCSGSLPPGGGSGGGMGGNMGGGMGSGMGGT
ncbi:MAG: YHYH protein [Pseudomonadota bacterium]